MATTFTDLDGNGQATRAFSFPSIKQADIKVDVDGTLYENRGITGASAGATTFTISSYTTTGGGNVVFDTAPASSSNKIRIFRDTDVDSPKATFTAGSSVKAGDLNNNMTQILYAAQEEQNQTILSSNIKDGTIKTADIGADQITTALIADDAITGDQLADNSISSQHIIDNQVGQSELAPNAVQTANITNTAVSTDKIANSAVTTAKIADGGVTTVKIAFENVTSDKIAANAITGAKIADNSISSQMIINNQVGQNQLAANSVQTSKIVDSAVSTAKIADGAVSTAKIATNGVTAGKIGNSQIITAKIADANVTTAKLADDAVTTAKITDANVTTAKIADGAITNPKLANNIVGTVKIIDSAVTTAKVAGGAITEPKLAANAINTAKIVDGNVTTVKIADDAVTTAKINGTAVTDAKLASNAVTTTKITDGNVTTVKIADSNVTLAKLASDLKQTSISNSDTQLPTSGAVVDYVAAQIAPIGGLEVIATEVAFPNVQPQSGVVISISDAQGVVVNGSGTSTTGRTVGGSTVTINNFPSSLNNETLAAGVGLMVSSTGSSQTYNYHKLLAAETDVKQLSDDINDFNARYRVGSSNPTSALDSGDLFFNTGSGKLLVYNGTSSAWEEAQSIGQYFINTISSSSGTGGGSATLNGSAYRFTLSNAGAVAEQHIVSVNGVVQKPNSGTSQPSEGFAIDGADIIFSSAPPNSADFFIITIGSTVNIGTPSNGTVSTAKLASDAVTTAKIADDAVTAAKLASDAVVTASIVDGAVTEPKIPSNAVTTAKIQDGAVTGPKIADATIALSKLAHGTSSNNGKFLRANNGADPTFETVNTDLVSDTSPQLGGDLQSNGNDIDFADGDKAIFGTHGDMQVFHDGSNSRITNTNTGSIVIKNEVQDADFMIQANDGGTNQNLLHFDTSETGLASFHGEINMRGTNRIRFYHNTGNGTFQSFIGQQFINNNFNMVIDNQQNSIFVQSDRITLRDKTGEGGEIYAEFIKDGAVELYHNGAKKFETASNGCKIAGSDGDGLHIENGGTNLAAQIHLKNTTVTKEYVLGVAGNTGANGQNSSLIFRDDTANVTRLELNTSGHLLPGQNNTYDLGSSTRRWRDIYTNDLNLSNEGSSNDVDGSWGDWTIQEGESDLFLKNNRSGKKYKFNLTEVS